jgi:predicted nucleic acid-binding protein
MRILIDTSRLVESERRNFDLGEWVVAARHKVFICDAMVAEYLAGKPLKDAGKKQRWQNYWESFVSLLESVPLGDGLHATMATLEDLTVVTVDVDYFKALGVSAVIRNVIARIIF